MAPMCYVFCKTEFGKEKEVIDGLKKIEGVKEVNGLYGFYAIEVKVHEESLDKIRDTVTNKIRKHPYIYETNSLIVAGDIE